MSRRPPSYSDSFIHLPKNEQPVLAPLTTETYVELPVIIEPPIKTPLYHHIVVFIIKGSLHIFFISTFETIFYFLYVSRSEDSGIKGTIDAYYLPIVESCTNWTNQTHAFMLDVLTYEVNKSSIDSLGFTAETQRTTHNNELATTSILYSVVCLLSFLGAAVLAHFKKIQIDWNRLLQEHGAFVVLLGLYEFFFFRTIIYKYITLSTPELNKYVVDGLYQCAMTSR
jgi:hypothetical protein